MNSKIKKYGKAALGLILVFALGFVLLIFTGTIWTSPSYYTVEKTKDFGHPIMSMEEYSIKGYHERPYIFHLKGKKGQVYVLGIDHTKDAGDPQIDSITRIWNMFNPDVALVEGRLGFLFSWFQDPVAVHGEGGKVLDLAKKQGTEYFTWEPEKQTEIDLMLKKYSPAQISLFYSLRPYLSNFRFGKPADPDADMQSYIESRTDYEGIRGTISNVKEIDSIWKKDFPNEKDWRDSTDEYGWPKGYLSEIAAYSNEVRDLHLCSAILELMDQEKKVLVTMGSSHAFRIRKTLEHELNGNKKPAYHNQEIKITSVNLN